MRQEDLGRFIGRDMSGRALRRPGGQSVQSASGEDFVTKGKPKISAKEVLDDLRSGMDDEGFMLKYKLSYRQLQDLFRKLIKAGFVTPIELAERLCVTSSQVTEVIKQVEKAVKELD